jgi:hypothetical protein
VDFLSRAKQAASTAGDEQEADDEIPF